MAEKLRPQELENTDSFVKAVRDYNAAVQKHRQENPNAIFDPSLKDDLSTRSASTGLALDKTNWALPIVKAPFLAVNVTCGITFTFGSLRIYPETSAVIPEATSQQIPGLYCADEMVGGLFYNNLSRWQWSGRRGGTWEEGREKRSKEGRYI